jgi:hypothetical protein
MMMMMMMMRMMMMIPHQSNHRIDYQAPERGRQEETGYTEGGQEGSRKTTSP